MAKSDEARHTVLAVAGGYENDEKYQSPPKKTAQLRCEGKSGARRTALATMVFSLSGPRVVTDKIRRIFHTVL